MTCFNFIVIRRSIATGGWLANLHDGKRGTCQVSHRHYRARDCSGAGLSLARASSFGPRGRGRTRAFKGKILQASRASRMNFGGGGRDSARGFLQVNAPAAGAPSRRRTGYNARVDRLDAIRLLKALVAAGAKPRAPMDSAWIDEIAVRDVSLHGTQLASALAYAEGQRWLTDSRTRKDWIYLTRTGEIVAKESVL
jgi:hypothetical protein